MELELLESKFKNLIIAWFKDERAKRSMTQKEFAQILGITPKAVDAREAKGLQSVTLVWMAMKKLGYDPKVKLEELISKASRN